MSFDLSRVTFNSWNDFLGAVMLQGRPQLDSDWNEFQAQFLRRFQAGTLDAIGQDVYPAALPNSFQIAASVSGGVNQILIGAGRLYVDGILAENHGPAASAQWDPVLAELSNTYPGATFASGALDFTQQPYFTPAPALLPGNGPFLVYLDVWQRPVTYIEDPNLVEKAVGVDTTGRLQTVWQVKMLDVSSVTPAVDCMTPLSSITPWVAATESSSGALTTNVVQSSPSGPCCLTPNTGYTGMENQLYRVEISVGGTLGTARFKWSRDNASVMTGVTGIATVTNTAGVTASQLTVQSMGRDEVLGFQVGDWIEILDDSQDYNCQAGFLHMIDSISASAKTITLDSTVDTTTVFPVSSGGLTDPTRHTRIRRWDQSGNVYDVNGNVVANVGQPGGQGDIPINDATTVIVLENGVTVQFSLNPTNGIFLAGDYWNFAARASDGSVEILTQAPPLGIHHHYTRLSVVTFPGTALDCRTQWPQPGAGGSGCGCTVTIGPGDVTATNTLQQVLDQFANQTTESVICLLPGTYTLSQPLRLTAAHSNITLDACQPGTAVLQVQAGAENLFNDGMVVLDGTNSFTLSGIQFNIPRGVFTSTSFAGLPVSALYPDLTSGVQAMSVAIGVRPINCDSLTIEQCLFLVVRYYAVNEPGQVPAGAQTDNPALAGAVAYIDAEAEDTSVGTLLFGAAVFAGGTCSNLKMTDNEIDGSGAFAGFLHAPAVSLKAAKTRQPIFQFPGANRRVLVQEDPFVGSAAATGQAAGAPRAQLDVASGRATGAVLTQENPVAAETFIPSANMAGSFDRSTALTNWVENGGSVLASSLTDATFEGNTFGNVAVAAMVLGEASAVSFTGNEVDGCKAGLWMLSPSMASMILFDAYHTSMVGLIVAMGYPLPQGDTSTPAAIAHVPATLRFYTGTKPYKDSLGNTWSPDVSAPGVTPSGGSFYQPGTAIASEIANADPSEADPALYENERYGTFSYTVAVPVAGFYQVTLKFMEIAYTNNATNSGVRIFDVSINGNKVLSNFDIASDAGGADISDDKVFSNIAPSNGQIVISFAGNALGSDHNAKISAVSIEPQWDGTVQNPYVSASDYPSYFSGELQNFYAQLAQLGQQGYAGLSVSPLELRLDDNEMTGLVAPGFLILGDDQLENGNIGTLMMSGNRLHATISIPAKGYDDPGASFLGAASVMLVTRCVVSGNMILNNGLGALVRDDVNIRDNLVRRFFPISLVLDDALGVTTDMAGPTPTVNVAGNVFKGEAFIFPPRFGVNSGVPAPMNAWAFLNTTFD